MHSPADSYKRAHQRNHRKDHEPVYLCRQKALGTHAVIPELPSAMIMPLFVIVTLLAVIVYKKIEHTLVI